MLHPRTFYWRVQSRSFPSIWSRDSRTKLTDGWKGCKQCWVKDIDRYVSLTVIEECYDSMLHPSVWRQPHLTRSEPCPRHFNEINQSQNWLLSISFLNSIKINLRFQSYPRAKWFRPNLMDHMTSKLRLSRWRTRTSYWCTGWFSIFTIYQK